MSPDEIKAFLPKYLSANSERLLTEAMETYRDEDFDTARYYTQRLEKEKTVFQGDGIKNLIIMDLPNLETKYHDSLVLSNTCDIDQSNQRSFDTRILYSPIIELKTYENMLSSGGLASEKIKVHIQNIRDQKISQILFLPQNNRIRDSIVFFDRICNISNDQIDRENLFSIRLFTLSDFGFYMLLIKMSIHFSRIQEKVDREGGLVL